MAAVTTPGGGDISGWAERNNAQATRLLGLMDAAKPIQHMSAPTLPHIGGDHPKPQGMFVEFLFGPGSFVWPQDSESALANGATSLGEQEQFYGEKADEVGDDIKQAFNNYWTAGKGAEAAESAYKQTMNALLEQAEVCKVAKGLVSRVSDDVGRTKRLMAQESDAAHAEVEAFLRSGSGQSTAQVAVILAAHRTIIQGHGAELHGHVANDTLLFTNKFKLAPGGGPKAKDAGNPGHRRILRRMQATTSGSNSSSARPYPAGLATASTRRMHRRTARAYSAQVPGNGLLPGRALLNRGWSGRTLGSAPGPLTSLLGSGGGFPGLSGMPGMPSGGGGGFPMSGLQGMFSNFGGFPGAGMASPAGLGGGDAASASASFGAGFRARVSGECRGGRRRRSAGRAGSDKHPSPRWPRRSKAHRRRRRPRPPRFPRRRQHQRRGTGSTRGRHAGRRYGAVWVSVAARGIVYADQRRARCRRQRPSRAGGGDGIPAAAGAGAGLLPVAGRRDGAAVRRDLAESDLQLARLAVAELAGAASVVDAGLDWAVAVGRNPTSGQTTLWVATNDGATYIPPGVYLRKTMPIAARFDDDFDARWFGWVNPAEKAVRAARARGDAVGAVATTWGWPSDFLEDPESGVREVATGVPQAGSDSPASELLPSRSHRLQTVDAALYADLQAAGERGVRDYCRELVRRLAFGGLGDELSPVAQSVADALVGGRWPKLEEWAALGAEYETALLLMGAQRPGLNGILDRGPGDHL